MTSPSPYSDPLFKDKVTRARAMTPEARALAGGDLFEYTREVCLAGIRQQHPDATEDQVRELFRQRLRIARQLENRP